MLTEQELQERSVKVLKQIQAAIRGTRTDKAQFDLVGKVLLEKGIEGLPWDKPVITDTPVADKKTIASIAAGMPKKELRAFSTASFIEIANDETIDEATRRELLVGCKHQQLYFSAKSRNKDFDLRLADVRKLLMAKRCAYTGIKLTDDQGPGFRTIDRIDADKGYVQGNVVAVASVANNVKNAILENEDSSLRMSEEELMTFAINMVKLAGK